MERRSARSTARQAHARGCGHRVSGYHSSFKGAGRQHPGHKDLKRQGTRSLQVAPSFTPSAPGLGRGSQAILKLIGWKWRDPYLVCSPCPDYDENSHWAGLSMTFPKRLSGHSKQETPLPYEAMETPKAGSRQGAHPLPALPTALLLVVRQT